MKNICIEKLSLINNIFPQQHQNLLFMGKLKAEFYQDL